MVTMIVKALFKKPDFTSSSAIRQHCIAHSVVSATPGVLFAVASGRSNLLGMIAGVVLFIICVERAHQLASVHAAVTGTLLGDVLHGVKLFRVAQCCIIMGFWLCFCVLWCIGSGPRDLDEVPIIFYIFHLPDGVAAMVADEVVIGAGLWSKPLLWLNVPSRPFLQATLDTFIIGIFLATGLLLFTLVLWVACLFLRYVWQALTPRLR
jgi:hypothetical protein